jgi:protein tyrosine phosphatase (PTP) superfamily phosphohydrolase (DUF442 family)
MQFDAESTHRVFSWLWTSGQITEQDIDTMEILDIDLVVNLIVPDSPYALAGEAESVTRRGINYVQIPVEWESPLETQFDQFLAVLDAFKGSRIWVHCAKNMRVSAFVYLYRKLVLLESEERARYPMCEVWTPNEIWRAFMERVEARYTPISG